MYHVSVVVLVFSPTTFPTNQSATKASQPLANLLSRFLTARALTLAHKRVELTTNGTQIDARTAALSLDYYFVVFYCQCCISANFHKRTANSKACAAAGSKPAVAHGLGRRPNIIAKTPSSSVHLPRGVERAAEIHSLLPYRNLDFLV